LAYELHKRFNPESSIENYKKYFDGNLFKKVDKKFNQKEHDEYRALEFEAFKNLKLEENIKKELKELSKKFDLYIISSNSIKNLELYFRNNNFTNIFKEILAAEVHKSKEEKFKILLEKYNIDKDSSIFITDTLGDILEANKVGIKTIAVDFGFHERERLEKGNPFRIVSNFEDIRKVIEEISNN
jgi:HAD superfamily hydrolase (TIGR01549 family)